MLVNNTWKKPILARQLPYDKRVSEVPMQLKQTHIIEKKQAFEEQRIIYRIKKAKGAENGLTLDELE